MFIKKLGGAGKKDKLSSILFSPKRQLNLSCHIYTIYLLYISLWFLYQCFSISVFLRYIDKFLFNCNFWPPTLKVTILLLLFSWSSLTDFHWFFCAQHCTSCSDDLELVFNSETSLCLINQIGTLGTLRSVNTCLNSSVTQFGCLISLKKKNLFQKARVRCL